MLLALQILVNLRPTPDGDAGGLKGIYWGEKKRKKEYKDLDWIVDKSISEYYGVLTDESQPEKVRKQAAKIIKPYAEDKKSVPVSVDWDKLEADLDRVMKLLGLYQQRMKIQKEDEFWIMFS